MNKRENQVVWKGKKIYQQMYDWLVKYQVFLLTAEALLIAAVSVYLCRNRAVDWDEAYTFNMVTRNTWGNMIRMTAKDVHPPLYYCLLKLAAMLFGDTFFVLKLCSVFFSFLTMVLGIWLVRKNWGWQTAALWIFVIGLGPQFLFYAVYMRMYSLCLFLSVGARCFPMR